MDGTIIVGLDGANWELLRPWLSAGRLPNLRSLRERGIEADLRSCLPPVTCPNWRCYSTGKNPGKLGVFWWEKIDVESRTLTTPTARSFESANFWEYLNDEGRSVGVMNLPMTYPPFDVDEFMIAGGPGSEPEGYAHPPSLEAELDAAGYRLHPERPVASSDDRAAATAVVDLIDERLETFRGLLAEREVDVAHCTVFYSNVLQHFFWRDEPTRRAWERIDAHLGALRDEHPEATLVLLSDHGCGPIETVFHANSWLEHEGYLRTERDASDVATTVGLDKQRISALAHRLGVHDVVTRLTPERVKRAMPEDDSGFKRERKLEKIDWEHTRAVASGQGLVYTTDEATTDALCRDLRSLESPITGEPIARAVFRREEAYDGPHVEAAPQIVFEQALGVHTSGAIGDNPPFTGTGHWTAENTPTGLFLADGPGVRGDLDGAASRVSITDVAPTVLASVGNRVPTDMDGEVLPLFEDRDVEYRDPLPFEGGGTAAGSEVRNRLKGLGYLE